MGLRSKNLGNTLLEKRNEIKTARKQAQRDFYPVCINGFSYEGEAMVRFVAPRSGTLRNIFVYLGANLPPGPMEQKAQIKVWISGGTKAEIYEIVYNRPLMLDRTLEVESGMVISLSRITDQDKKADITVSFEFG